MIDWTTILLKDYKMSGKYTSSSRLKFRLTGTRHFFITYFWTNLRHYVLLALKDALYQLVPRDTQQNQISHITPHNFAWHLVRISTRVRIGFVFVFVFYDPGKPLHRTICLYICHGRIIARCLCSCLSLANLHLPSSLRSPHICVFVSIFVPVFVFVLVYIYFGIQANLCMLLSVFCHSPFAFINLVGV